MTSNIGQKRKQTTEVLSETQDLTWDLKNFKGMIEIPHLLDNTKLNFEAGHSINLPTKWQLVFDTSMIKQERLGVYVKLLESPEDQTDVYARLEITVKRANGKNFFHTSMKTQNMKAKDVEEWGFSNGVGSLKSLRSNSMNVLKDGTLTLHIHFELFDYDKTKPESLISTKLDVIEPKIAKLQNQIEESRLSVSADLEKLLKSEKDADVTFVMEDGKTLKAHKAILSIRSPVFQAMFDTEMTEAASGTVTVDDLTFDTMELILQFIYTGILPDNWTQHLEEVVYGAEKYSVALLKKVCDEALITICTRDNAMDLLKLAKKFNLETGIKDVTEYAQNNMFEIMLAAQNQSVMTE